MPARIVQLAYWPAYRPRFGQARKIVIPLFLYGLLSLPVVPGLPVWARAETTARYGTPILGAPSHLAGQSADPLAPSPTADSTWDFGRSNRQDAPLWQYGAEPDALYEKAIPREVQERKAAKDIENALELARQQADPQTKGGFHLQMERKRSHWREAPAQEGPQLDEAQPLASRHVLKGHVGLEKGEDLRFSTGPELILKDERNLSRNAPANESQPQSELGVGMQFTLGF